MNDVTYVACGGQTSLVKGDVLRLTFSAPWYYLDADFRAGFPTVWDGLATAGAYPITPNNGASGPPTTVDVRVSSGVTVAQLLEKIGAIDFWGRCVVTRCEKLSATDAAQAAGSAGAQQRNQTDQQQKQQESESGLTGWFRDLGNAIGTSVKVLVWVALVVVVIVLLSNAGKIRSALKGA